jgi:threonine dehydratase
MKLTLKHCRAAYDVLRDIIDPTPLIKNEWLSTQYGCEVWLKLENMLPIGSFKMRGATYKISRLSNAEKKRGVLAVSAGNHAQGVAWAARKFGVQATIIMPEGSPLTKIRNTESLGAKVVLHGASIEECFAYAEELMKKKPMVFVHPFKDVDVMAGQSTVGFEILEQLSGFDYVFSSIGGGGLVSGLGTVIKGMSPKTKIIAGQAAGCSAMVDSLQKGKIVANDRAETFADGIRVKVANPEMFKILKDVVDETIAIDDDRIALAVVQLMEKTRVIAEGAGALPLAALNELHKQNPKRFKGKKVVLVVCGGNIDVNLLERIIDRGLIESKRKVMLSVPIADRPGTLHRLTGIIKENGANILQVHHDRDSEGTGISGANVVFTLETKGPAELEKLVEQLRKDFPRCRVM